MTDTEKLPADWAIEKAMRLGNVQTSLEQVKTYAATYTTTIPFARCIEKYEQPPVSQELLIWREVFARSCDEIGETRQAESYRKGLKDFYFSGDKIIKEAIELALEGFGKEGAS